MVLAMLSSQRVNAFSPSEGKAQAFFLNPPTATVPHTATSNGLIGLLHKCVEIKNWRECGGGRVEREEDRVGVNGLITA